MQIGPKMEAGDCPTLNMNAMENYLLSHSLTGNSEGSGIQGANFLMSTIESDNILLCAGLRFADCFTGKTLIISP